MSKEPLPTAQGLERLVEGGGDPGQVHSVASFFVSRVDTETDRRLDETGGDATKLKVAGDFGAKPVMIRHHKRRAARSLAISR